jgi:hypothetical protein
METGIYKKLLTVQEKLKAPKSQYNDFGKYNYRNCEDILEAVKPILAKINVALIITDKIINIQQRFYVEATAKFIDADTGEGAEVKAYAREDEAKKGMDGSQITGSSSSYARKYALNGLFLIDDTKDSDATNKGDTSKTHENTPKTPTTSKGANTPATLKCEGCGAAITDKVATYSTSKFGKKLCFDCQKKASVKR